MSNKKNISVASNRTLKFLIITKLCFLMFLPSAAIADSTGFDFGSVAVGDTSTATVTIHNETTDEVQVTGAEFLFDTCSDFSTAYRDELIKIPSGGTFEIDVVYTPSQAGECSNELRIWTNNPSLYHLVALSGTGVVVGTSAEDKIKEILEYLDTRMKGKGSGKSAENRLNALRSMIQAAAVHIRKGQTKAALNQLSEVYKKVDGFSKPMDFIDEEPTNRTNSLNTLAGLIQDLMKLLESDSIRTGKCAESKGTA
jgi:hypothetical protein